MKIGSNFIGKGSPGKRE